VRHRFDQQPAPLDVVPEGDALRQGIPAVIEEETEMMRFGINDVLKEDLDQAPLPGTQVPIVPDAQQVRVGLQQVQERVHGFAAVRLLVAEAHVGQLAPGPAAALDVAPVSGVVGVRLDQPGQLLGQPQTLCLAGRTVVFRQAIDGECLGVGVFAVVDWACLPVHGPVDAAMLVVPEGAAKGVIGVTSRREVGSITVPAVGRSAGPQDACTQHRRPRHVLQDLQVIGQRAVEPTVLAVHRLLHPKRQDVPNQLVLEALPEVRSV
jgi:hypothetical protein